ncbi:MAG TPA: RES family NAD+ phosphorylase [Gemmatimonadales bacterium]
MSDGQPAEGALPEGALPEGALPEGALPGITLVRRFDTHRLVPSRYRPGGESVLALIADDDAHLADIFDLDHATNDRLLAEHDLLPGIGVHELLFGVPGYRVVNAAFTHAHPLGSRFNGPDRGAWYAAFDVETSLAEVSFHRAVELAEIGRWEDTVTYDDYLSDVSAGLHDLRGDARFARCLAPDSYVESQSLAARLLDAGSLGLVYPSVRHAGGTCLACLRPAVVGNVRRDRTYRLTWEGGEEPRVEGE